jgi:hypothetical protein
MGAIIVEFPNRLPHQRFADEWTVERRRSIAVVGSIVVDFHDEPVFFELLAEFVGVGVVV